MKKPKLETTTTHIHARTYPSLHRKLRVLRAKYPSLRSETSALLFAAEEGLRTLGIADPSPEMEEKEEDSE